ncbi:MAG: hypothetical protein AABY22_11125, partial [Nanoarchaeota archaeon]
MAKPSGSRGVYLYDGNHILLSDKEVNTANGKWQWVKFNKKGQSTNYLFKKDDFKWAIVVKGDGLNGLVYVDKILVTEDSSFDPNPKEVFVLDVPLPLNSKCFWQNNRDLSECKNFYKNKCNESGSQCYKELACSQYYNPVYDSKGIFYPTACWAEQLGVVNYSYGYSNEMKQFLRDMWYTPKTDGFKSYYVPSPNIGFEYHGSYNIPSKYGVFLRSSLWRDNKSFSYLDFYINTQERNYTSTSFDNSKTVSVYGRTQKILLVFVMFDDVYPKEVLINWTNEYMPLMNDYIRKKQKVSNPIQYDIVPLVIQPPEGVSRPT